MSNYTPNPEPWRISAPFSGDWTDNPQGLDAGYYDDPETWVTNFLARTGTGRFMLDRPAGQNPTGNGLVPSATWQTMTAGMRTAWEDALPTAGPFLVYRSVFITDHPDSLGMEISDGLRMPDMTTQVDTAIMDALQDEWIEAGGGNFKGFVYDYAASTSALPYFSEDIRPKVRKLFEHDVARGLEPMMEAFPLVSGGPSSLALDQEFINFGRSMASAAFTQQLDPRSEWTASPDQECRIWVSKYYFGYPAVSADDANALAIAYAVQAALRGFALGTEDSDLDAALELASAQAEIAMALPSPGQLRTYSSANILSDGGAAIAPQRTFASPPARR